MNENNSAVPDKLTRDKPCQEQIFRILPRQKVVEVTGISRSLIYELVRAGSFPKPVRLTPNRVGWIEHEVQQWLQARAALRKLG
ncbi:AlpA family phage regulatory protein [Burkholderia cepacia]|nr:AlpA family phage regulatory protein [Burkholderia cepacia]